MEEGAPLVAYEVMIRGERWRFERLTGEELNEATRPAKAAAYPRKHEDRNALPE